MPILNVNVYEKLHLGTFIQIAQRTCHVGLFARLYHYEDFDDIMLWNSTNTCRATPNLAKMGQKYRALT